MNQGVNALYPEGKNVKLKPADFRRRTKGDMMSNEFIVVSTSGDDVTIRHKRQRLVTFKVPHTELV